MEPNEILEQLAEQINNIPDDQIDAVYENYDSMIEIMNVNNKLINEIKEQFAWMQSTETDIIRIKDLFINQIEQFISSQENEKKLKLLSKIKNKVTEVFDIMLTEGLEPRIPIKTLVVHENAVMPQYAHEGDACVDLSAVEDTNIPAGATVLIHTGLKFIIPFGYEMQIRPRSGMSLKTNLRVANAPGTIDSNYRGEVCIIMTNIGQENYEIKQGDRIAQAIIQKVPYIYFELTEEKDFNDNTDRGNQGFGSSGK